MDRPTCIAWVYEQNDIAIQVRWAVHLARTRKMDLHFLLRIEAQQHHLTEIDLTVPPKPDARPSILELRQAISASLGGTSAEQHDDVEDTTAGKQTTSDIAEGGQPDRNIAGEDINVTVKALYSNDFEWGRKTTLEEVAACNAALFTIALNQVLGSQNREFVIERDRLVEFLPCELIVCQGFTDDMDFAHPAVLERPGSSQQAALRLASDLVGDGGHVTAFQVNPDVGVDAALVGEKRLERFLSKRPVEKPLTFSRHVAVNDNLQNGVQALWTDTPCDLLIVPGTTLKAEQGVGFRMGHNIPVAVVLSASPLASRTREFVKESFRHRVPQIARVDRVALVERVQSNAEWNFDFVALMILSASIAAFGLMQNSTAVVIGAMLVAPLMTPIIGLGLALVQGNLMLTKISLRALTRGIGLALLCGMVLGVLNSGFTEPTREIFARTQPGILDIAVAFFSGLAAAYAQSRPNLVAALPGVAIAAALVPPIVASGLLLSLWELERALGAFSLFVINMVAIVLASMLALFAVGIRRTKQQVWPARITAAIIATFTGLVVWSSANTYDVDFARRVPLGLEAAIEDVLGPEYSLESVAVAYDELGYQLNLLVVGDKPIEPDISKAVRATAGEFYGEASRIRLISRVSAEEF